MSDPPSSPPILEYAEDLPTLPMRNNDPLTDSYIDPLTSSPHRRVDEDLKAEFDDDSLGELMDYISEIAGRLNKLKDMHYKLIKRKKDEIDFKKLSPLENEEIRTCRYKLRSYSDALMLLVNKLLDESEV